MVKDVLIHIGYHKTGTSWLQDNLFNNDDSVFYSLSALAPHFIFDEQGYYLNSFDMNNQVIGSKLNAMLAECPVPEHKTAVISYERLSGSPFAGGVNALSHARRLSQTFPEAKVLIVIRKQSDAILSAYFQYLTGGGTHSLKRFLNSKFNGLRPYFTLNHYRYDHVIQAYQSLFGKENVLIQPYELFKDDKKIFFNKLGLFIAKPVTVDGMESQAYVNKNHHQFVRYRFRFLNGFIKKTELNNFSPYHNRFSKALAWRFMRMLFAFPFSSLDSKQTKKMRKIVNSHIGRQFDEGNRKVAELIGEDLSILGYY